MMLWDQLTAISQETEHLWKAGSAVFPMTWLENLLPMGPGEWKNLIVPTENKRGQHECEGP